MNHLLGEYECKIDAKGRLKLPTALMRQLGTRTDYGLVLNRGLEKNLAVYTREEWNKLTDELSGLNMYVKENRDFVRFIHRGATETTLDSAERILIPKRLADYAGIDKDVIVFAYFNRIEIWAKDAYDAILDEAPENYAALAERVMGGSRQTEE